MGGAFTGNISAFYAVDLDSVLTIYRMLDLCSILCLFILQHNLYLRLKVDFFLSSITNKTLTGLGKTSNTAGILGGIGTVYRQEILGSSRFLVGSVSIIVFFSQSFQSYIFCLRSVSSDLRVSLMFIYDDYFFLLFGTFFLSSIN